MMVPTNEQQFYFQGKVFETFAEMIKYTQEWGNTRLNQETATRLLQALKDDILINVFMYPECFTNQQFNNCLNEIFSFAIFKIRNLEHNGIEIQ